MKQHWNHIIFLLFLLLFGNAKNVFGQTYTLKQLPADTDLKIICDSAYFFMDRKDIVSYMMKLQKQEKKSYKILIKKINGVCFEAINLRKKIDDVEITQVQQVLLHKIIYTAITQKKVAIQWKKSNEYLSTVIDKEITDNAIANATNIKQHIITDANGTIVFDEK